jgi:quercetin dioxygenase-like cupin family protein
VSDAKAHRWDGLDREVVRRGVERVGFRGENVLLVMNWLDPGMEVNPHSHPFEQVLLILQGQMRLTVGDDVHVIEAGGMMRIPPDVVHCGEPIGDEQVINLDVFSPIREDYRHLVEYQKDDFEAVTEG